MAFSCNVFFFNFFKDVYGRMLTFRSFFGRALSRNAFKSDHSVADIPRKVKKTSSDIAILLNCRTIVQNNSPGFNFVDRLGTLASLGRCERLGVFKEGAGLILGVPIYTQTPDQPPKRTLCY